MARRLAIHASSMLVLAMLAWSGTAHATSIEATDNATVQPGGPRSGSNGKAFFNLEGSGNGNFASFGVIDFNLAGLGLGPVSDVANVMLHMTESNAGFSTNGPLSVYYTSATGVDIQPGAAIVYQSGNNGVASVDPAFGALTLLGSGQYTNTANGTVESFALSFSGTAKTGFLDALNNGTTLRLIVTPDAASTAATYAGYTHNTYAGPTLEFNAVPEPTTTALVGLGVLGLAFAQWRRRTK